MIFNGMDMTLFSLSENDLVQEDEDDIAKRSFDEREFLKKKAKGWLLNLCINVDFTISRSI